MQVSPPPHDELEVLLREVLKVPEEELEAAMALHPWHRFYTQVRLGHGFYRLDSSEGLVVHAKLV